MAIGEFPQGITSGFPLGTVIPIDAPVSLFPSGSQLTLTAPLTLMVAASTGLTLGFQASLSVLVVGDTATGTRPFNIVNQPNPFGLGLVFNYQPTFRNLRGTALSNPLSLVFTDQALYQITNDNTWAGTDLAGIIPCTSFFSGRVWNRIAGAGTGALATVSSVFVRETIDAGWSCTSYAPIKIARPLGAGTIAELVVFDLLDFDAGGARSATEITMRSATPSATMRHAGAVKFGTNSVPITTAGAILEVERDHSTAAGIVDGFAAAITLDPAYTGTGGVQTITRHNYIDMQNVSTTSATVTGGAAIRFDADVGTHTCLAANGAVLTVLTGAVGPTAAETTVQGWLRVNINGTIRHIPFW